MWLLDVTLIRVIFFKIQICSLKPAQLWQICPHSLLAAALPSPPREGAFPAVLEGIACNTDLLLPAKGSPVLEELVLLWCCGTCLPVTVRASVSPCTLSRHPSMLL